MLCTSKTGPAAFCAPCFLHKNKWIVTEGGGMQKVDEKFQNCVAFLSWLHLHYVDLYVSQSAIILGIYVFLFEII